GVVHWPAAPRRKAVSGQVHDVDVGRALSDAFLEDLRSFVDEGKDAALHDFLGGNVAPDDGHLARRGDDQLLHHGIRDGVAPPRLVPVPAGGGLLPDAPHLAEPVGYHLPPRARVLCVAALADEPAHVAACEVRHAERAHGHAELLHDPVDLLGQRSLLDEQQRLLDVAREHAVADEAVAHAGDDTGLSQFLRQAEHGGEYVLGGLAAAYDLQQLHHVRWAEEMSADHVGGTAR